MLDITGTFKKFFGGNFHEILGTIRGLVGEENIQKGMKAVFPFFSTVDEVLAIDSVVIAVRDRMISSAEAIEFARRLLHLQQSNPGGAARVIEIIGKGEQAVTRETSTPQKEGKPNVSKETRMENSRGAGMVTLLAKMTEQEMFEFLRGMGASVTPTQRMYETLDRVLGRLPEHARAIARRAIDSLGSVPMAINRSAAAIEDSPDPLRGRLMWPIYGLLIILGLIGLSFLAV